MASTVNGHIHCPRCTKSVKAKCVIRSTRDASFVTWDGHDPVGGRGLKGRCKGGKIMFAGVGFPQWAHKAVNNAFR